MNKTELIIRITTLKEIRDNIQIKIDSLENEAKQLDEIKKETPINLDINTESGFFSYLTVIKKLDEHTAHNYFSYLRGIKTRLKQYINYKIDIEIYNISNKETLIDIKNHMDSCEAIQKDNKRQHNSLTAAFNNYVSYIFNYYNQNKEYISNEFVFDD